MSVYEQSTAPSITVPVPSTSPQEFGAVSSATPVSHNNPVFPPVGGVSAGPGSPVSGDDSDPATERNRILKRIFGSMYRAPDGVKEFEKIIRPPNANSLTDLMSFVEEHRHHGSCFCKFCGTVGSICVPCALYHRIKVVQPDEFGMIVHSGYPEIVGPGTYCLPSCRQHFTGKHKQNYPYIHVCNLHIIQIPKGQIGLAMDAGKPVFLDYGRHCYYNGMLVFDETLKNRSDLVITHGNVTVVNVPRGSLGYGTFTGQAEPVILGEGMHVIQSPFFKLQNLINLNSLTTSIGPMKLVRVETGSVGCAYLTGKLTILQPGLHLLVPPDRFHGFLCTQQTVLPLPEAVHESGDYVPLKVKADVFYRIADPLLAVTAVDDIERTIRETAAATLAGIIRSSTLQDIAKSSKATHGGETPGQEMPSFYAFVHDHFISELHDDCLRKWGIELLNIRIESMSINNPILAKEISSQSLIYAQTQAQLANLESDRHIKETEAIRDANIAIQKADAEKKSRQLAASADAQALITEKRAQAEGDVQKAQGEVSAIKIRAEADAAAARKTAEAECERLKLEGEGHEMFLRAINESKNGARFARLELEKSLLRRTDTIYVSHKIPTVFSATGILEDVHNPDIIDSNR